MKIFQGFSEEVVAVGHADDAKTQKEFIFWLPEGAGGLGQSPSLL